MKIFPDNAGLILDNYLKYNHNLTDEDKAFIKELFYNFPELKNVKDYKNLLNGYSTIKINYVNGLDKKYSEILGRGTHNIALKEYAWGGLTTDQVNKAINMLINDNNISHYSVWNNG